MPYPLQVVDKSVVEERNTRIRAIAKEKVNSLNTVKQFRKRLNELDWQHKMLGLRTDDLEERTKDVRGEDRAIGAPFGGT